MHPEMNNRDWLVHPTYVTNDAHYEEDQLLDCKIRHWHNGLNTRRDTCSIVILGLIHSRIILPALYQKRTAYTLYTALVQCTWKENQAPALIIAHQRKERSHYLTAEDRPIATLFHTDSDKQEDMLQHWCSLYLKYDWWPQYADSRRMCQFPCGHKHIHLDPISPPTFREFRHFSQISPMSPPCLCAFHLDIRRNQQNSTLNPSRKAKISTLYLTSVEAEHMLLGDALLQHM